MTRAEALVANLRSATADFHRVWGASETLPGYNVFFSYSGTWIVATAGSESAMGYYSFAPLNSAYATLTALRTVATSNAEDVVDCAILMAQGATGEGRNTSKDRTQAKTELAKRIKIKVGSAPSTVRTLEQIMQEVWDDPDVPKTRKAGIVIEGARVSRQVVTWDAGARINALADQQQVLVQEILRLRSANEILQRAQP